MPTVTLNSRSSQNRFHWLWRAGRWCLRKLRGRKKTILRAIKQKSPDVYRLIQRIQASAAADVEGNVVGLKMLFQQVTDDDLAFLIDLPELTDLQILYCPQVTNRTMEYLAWTRNLRILMLNGASISAFGLRSLRGHQGLEAIDLGDTWAGTVTERDIRSIPDDDPEKKEILQTFGFSYLKSFPKLKELHLNGSKFLGDSSMAGIAQAKNLKVLMAAGTGVTDQGLRHLYGHPKLELVCLIGTQTTPEGLEELRLHLPPGCDVS